MESPTDIELADSNAPITVPTTRTLPKSQPSVTGVRVGLILMLVGTVNGVGCAKRTGTSVEESPAAMQPAPAAVDTAVTEDSVATVRAPSRDRPSPSRRPPPVIADLTARPRSRPAETTVSSSGYGRTARSEHARPVAAISATGSGLSPADSEIIERGIAGLRAAKIYFEGPDTFFISKPGAVQVGLVPLTSPQPAGTGAPVRPDTTRIGTLTEVCLTAPNFKIENESGEEKHCREQVIPFSRNTYWNWSLTALPEIKTSGSWPIGVAVNVTFSGMPKYTVYRSAHKAYVYVEAESLIHRTTSFLNDWKALLVAIAGILGILAAGAKWLKSRGLSAA